MKRTLTLLLAVLALMATSCKPAYEQVQVKGWEIGNFSGIGLGASGVSAALTAVVDVDNGSGKTVSLESLAATLYNKGDGTRFADIALKEPKSVEPRTRAKVALPLELKIANPLGLLLSGGLDHFDSSAYLADIDLDVKMGGLKKHISQERVPLEELARLFDKNAKTESK